jgi:hypothetical protein
MNQKQHQQESEHNFPHPIFKNQILNNSNHILKK